MAKIATASKTSNKPAVVAKQKSTSSNSLQQEIAKQAYQFFVERGCQHGHDLEDWARAEAIVHSRRS